MRAGRLRHRVELQSLDQVQDSFGEQVKSFTTYATVWAEVNPLKGKEIEAAQQIFAEAECKIVIRYDERVTETDKIVFDGQDYEIGDVRDPYERKGYLEIMCKVIK